MIISFKHKGLKFLFINNNSKYVNSEHAPKLIRILDRLDASTKPEDMKLPGYNLHELSGKEKGTWTVKVNGNWRVTFSFYGVDATLVDYLDYH